jgi:predicted transcriptional regulator
MPGKQKPALSELENKVMGLVWEHGRATAELVREKLEGSQPIKDSTVRTILRRLEQKGYVRHVSEGRTYVYSPTVASQNVAVEAVRGIIERFCNGSVENLLVGMVDSQVVSPHKLQELAGRIVAEKDRETKGTKKKSQRRKET